MTKTGFFQNKTIVITGGAEGIGAAIAEQFAIEGANIFIIARNQAKLDKFSDYLYKNHPENRVAVFSCDIGSYTQVRSVVKSIVRLVGKVDGLVHCTGSFVPGYLEKSKVDIFERSMSVKYMGGLYFVKELLPYLNTGGFISFMAGVTGFMPLHGAAATVGPDFALFGLAQTLRVEMADRNISVHLLVPFITETEVLQKNLKKSPPEVKAFYQAFPGVDPVEVAQFFMKNLKKRKFLMFFDYRTKIWYQLKNLFPGIFSWWFQRRTPSARLKPSNKNESVS